MPMTETVEQKVSRAFRVEDHKGSVWILYDIGVFRGYAVSRKGLMEMSFGVIATNAPWDSPYIKVPVFTDWWEHDSCPSCGSQDWSPEGMGECACSCGRVFCFEDMEGDPRHAD